MSTTDTPRTDACPHCGERNDGFELYACGTCLQYWDDEPQLAQSDLCRYYEMQLRAEKAEAEVDRLRDAFSRLTDEIECNPKCSSYQAGYCDCGRLERAYAISDSIPQNPTK